MKAAEIDKGGSYIANVEGTPEVVKVTRIGKTAHQKYQRTSYRCLVIRTGKLDSFNDTNRFQRVATKDEISKAKGEK